MHTASLLLAARVKLRQPCTHNRLTTSMLVARAAEDATLTPAERDAWLDLVDAIEHEAPSAPAGQGAPARPPLPNGLHGGAYR